LSPAGGKDIRAFGDERCTVASPMPLLPPVITATLPFNLSIMYLLSGFQL
jgi:hypothetical protein